MEKVRTTRCTCVRCAGNGKVKRWLFVLKDDILAACPGNISGLQDYAKRTIFFAKL